MHTLLCLWGQSLNRRQEESESSLLSLPSLELCDIEHFMNTQSPSSADRDDGLRCLVLDLNSFFASCEQQENPDLRDKPLIVVPVMSDTTCAIAASYPAKACGIQTGTLVAEAKKMCPGLRLVQARPPLYVTYHHRILEAIETCLPIDEVMSVDEVACRLDKIQQQPAEARRLAARIKTMITHNVGSCLTSSIGIAPNKLLAKLASDMQKPDGLVILRKADLPKAILHLAPSDIVGIGPRMALRLTAGGIHTMHDLWEADAQKLRRVWGGIVGLRFHALLHGADLPSTPSPRRSLGRQHVLAPEERTLSRALPLLRQLLIRAAEKLRAEDFFCQRLYVEIKGVRNLGFWGDERQFGETQDTGLLLRLTEEMWKGAPPSLKPLRVGVVLSGLVESAHHQPDLFDGKVHPSRLMEAVDALNARFGRGTLQFGTPPGTQLTTKIAFQRVPGMEEF